MYFIKTILVGKLHKVEIIVPTIITQQELVNMQEKA